MIRPPSMPTDPQDLERRIALATDDDLVRGFNFGAIFALVEKHVGPGAAEELRAPLGKRVLGFFDYPAAEFLRVAFRAADLLEPHFGCVDAAFRAMGEAASRALMGTSVGRTLISFMRGNPPDQALRHMPMAYGMAVSFGERTVVPMGECSARIVFKNELMPPAYHEGVMRAGLDEVGLPAIVEGLSTGPSECELIVRWAPRRPSTGAG